ncbi:unnamed protein product, partial [Cladocopium goreaui]
QRVPGTMVCEMRAWLHRPPDHVAPASYARLYPTRKAHATTKHFDRLRACLAGCAATSVMTRLPRQSLGSGDKNLLIKRLSAQYGCSEEEVERSLSVFRLADRSGDGSIQRE